MSLAKISVAMLLAYFALVTKVHATGRCMTDLLAVRSGVAISESEVIVNVGNRVWKFTGPNSRSGSFTYVEAIKGVLSPDHLRVAVLVEAHGDYTTSSSIYFYSVSGEHLNTISVQGGTDLVWPSSQPDRLILPFYKTHYISDWELDTRFDQNTITVGSDIVDIQTGKVIKTISHNLGWHRYQSRPWPYKEYYDPQFKILWSKTGDFFADIDGDIVKIYRFDQKQLQSSYERTESLKKLLEQQLATLGLADDVTEFVREIAEAIQTQTDTND